MPIQLEFKVKPGDVFRYQSTFTSRRNGKTTTNTVQSTEQVVAVTPDGVQWVQLEDPDALVTVYDRRGYPIDVLQGGRSVKGEIAEDAFDISNQLIFPPGPVNPGDTWEAEDGVVRVSFRFVGVGAQQGREAAEIHSTTSGYNGPIKHWVELSTGRLVRKEYLVGSPDSSTTTVIMRV